jgi:hypothetical protein
MPPGLSAPDARPEAGVDHVDVMDLLGLKRAKPIGKDTTKSGNDFSP